MEKDNSILELEKSIKDRFIKKRIEKSEEQGDQNKLEILRILQKKNKKED